MNQPDCRPRSAQYVIQSATRPECFLQIEQRGRHGLNRFVMAPFFDEAHEFDTYFHAEDFAQKNLMRGSYVVRTKVNGYLLPLARKAMVA